MLAYLVQLTDALNTTLDLQTLLNRTSELVRAIIHYRIFAILLLNDRTHELRMRFQIGHTPQVERTRIPMGKGVVGQVALTRQPMLLNDVTRSERLHRRQSRCALRAGGAADRQEPPDRRDGSRKRAGRLLSPRASAPAHADGIAHCPGHRECAALCARLAPGADARQC